MKQKRSVIRHNFKQAPWVEKIKLFNLSVVNFNTQLAKCASQKVLLTLLCGSGNIYPQRSLNAKTECFQCFLDVKWVFLSLLLGSQSVLGGLPEFCPLTFSRC